MLLVESYSIHRVIPAVCFCAKLATDCDLRSQPNDAHADFICNEGLKSLVYVSGVRGEKRSKDYQHLSGTMAGRVTAIVSRGFKKQASTKVRILQKCTPGHLQGILQAR